MRLELAYLPPIAWCARIWNQPVVRLEAQEHFQKGTYRNRCLIASPNGIQRLSIPLVHGKHQQTPIREVRIAYDTSWQLQHWRSIMAAYGNAPFFEHYRDALKTCYEQPFEFLFDFNFALLQHVFHKIGWPGTWEFTENYMPKDAASTFDFRDTVSPKSAVVPAWFFPAPYSQVFMEKHGFLPDLSILDLLFCCGRQSGEILAKSCITL